MENGHVIKGHIIYKWGMDSMAISVITRGYVVRKPPMNIMGVKAFMRI